ncbi:MAG: efflux transporter outer membrane subunit [Planctomycetes bacterium]|nr:efflux transporter outer membrane subunit [Polyangiaceae bacterium]MCB9910027.1 efflux transporter outer membrane subunit [Planctomycetota bacterium]
MTTLTTARPSRAPRGLLLVASLFVTGCAAVGPDYVPPTVPVPAGWSSDLADGVRAGAAELEEWWKLFEDPVLSSLVDRASEGNLDLRAAVSRIDEARAMLGVARGARLPRIDVDASYSRSRQSSESSLGGKTLGDIVSVSDVDTYTTAIGAGWELDVFGRVRRSVESSHANWQASVEDYGGVLVALRAEVALVYIESRSLQDRIAIAERNVVSQRASREIVRKRREAGTAPGLELAQADGNVASTEATLPQLRAQLRLATNRLSVLLGEHPGALEDELGTQSSVPSPPESTLVSIPADLLRKRPDIRRAERLLAAQTARVGVATADLYPRLSLSGVFGFSAQSPGDLFQSSSRTFGVGPSLVWNVFAGGSVRSAIDVEDARVTQALVAYEHTVLRALEDVEGALTGYSHERTRNTSLRSAVDAYRRAVGFAEDLYKGGKTDFQNVLDAQRNLLAFEDQLATSNAALVEHLVALYRAMGGAWNVRPEERATELPRDTSEEGEQK